MKKIKDFIIGHKVVSIIVSIVVIFIAWKIYGSLTSTAGDTRYVMSTATKDTIIVSVTGSGQVNAGTQIDMKPKVSGDVVYLGVASGQNVKAGTLIAQLDSTDAQKTVRDAQANLDSAKISLAKLQEPTDNLSLLQAQNALNQSNSDLTKSYDDGFNSVSSAFIDMPTVITGIDTILHKQDANPAGGNSQWNIDYYSDSARSASINDNGKANQFKTDAESKYQIARSAYDKNFIDYKNLSRSSDPGAISSVINETYNTSKLIADAVKSSSNLIQYYQDTLNASQMTITAKSTTHITTLGGYTNLINTHMTDLLNIKNTISNDTISIPEKQAALDKLKAGADVLDIQSAQLAVTQRENALADAKSTLNDYYIRAPFDGTIATLNIKKYDSVSSGTVISSFITTQQLAQLSLNEVDAAKVKIGQKATMTFDAIDGLTITGQVASIDSVGTVAQGVVTYNIKISFDTSDDRIKPGMSVSAEIIIDAKPDVLTVPNSAVKNQGGTSYVEMFDAPLPAPVVGVQGSISLTPPRQQIVQVGLSNDTYTEIISGLKEGDQVVTRTILPAGTTSAAPSLLGAIGGNSRGGLGGGGGGARPATANSTRGN